MRPTVALRADPKLAPMAAALRDAFGARLVSALLFGSRARGDHKPDSDYDVAVFLHGYERDRDQEILHRLCERLGEDAFTLQFWPFGKDGLAERTTLMFNIRNEAVPLPGLAWPTVVAPSISPDEGSPTPEAGTLMRHAEALLLTARKLAALGFHEPAAREAYRAALLAARSLVFEELTLAPKSHDETEALFDRSAIKSGRIDPKHRSTLSAGHQIQMDSEWEPISTTTDEQAAAYVERAAEFVSAIKRLIEP